MSAKAQDWGTVTTDKKNAGSTIKLPVILKVISSIYSS